MQRTRSAPAVALSAVAIVALSFLLSRFAFAAAPHDAKDAGAGVAADADAAEPIMLAYDAPKDCPDSNAFFREISARTTRVRATQSASDDARLLRVSITKEGDVMVGRLSMHDASSKSRTREVRGRTCGEIVEALGLIAALALDPNASTSASASSPSPSSSSSVAANEQPPPPLPTTTPEPPTKSDKEVGADSSTTKPVGPVSSNESQLGFAVGAQVEGAALADVVMAGRLFGEIELGDRRSSTTSSLFFPSIRVAIARSLDVERRPAIGRASLTWTQAAVDACPLRMTLATQQHLYLRPCAAIAAGVLTAESTQIDQARSRSRPWVSASVHGRLAWEIVPAFALDAEAGAVIPLTREEFFFDPGISVYQSPILALFGRVGASVRFP